MGTKRQLTAIIEREEKGFYALCPEFDVASQGASVEEARQNLAEAVGLFLEAADPKEITKRLHDEVRIGTLLSIIRQSALPKNVFEV